MEPFISIFFERNNVDGKKPFIYEKLPIQKDVLDHSKKYIVIPAQAGIQTFTRGSAEKNKDLPATESAAAWISRASVNLRRYDEDVQ